MPRSNPAPVLRTMAVVLIASGIGAAIVGLAGLGVDSGRSLTERIVIAIAGVGSGVVAGVGGVALWRSQSGQSS